MVKDSVLLMNDKIGFQFFCLRLLLQHVIVSAIERIRRFLQQQRRNSCKLIYNLCKMELIISVYNDILFILRVMENTFN